MAATAHDFPSITPSQRKYTPATFPTAEFQGLNGAVTTLQYGAVPVDSKLEMVFENIPDEKAWEILENYEAVNGGRDSEGERDYVRFSSSSKADATDGVANQNLRQLMGERLPGRAPLRYRYAEPPTITSVFPGYSTVTVNLRGYLEV